MKMVKQKKLLITLIFGILLSVSLQEECTIIDKLKFRKYYFKTSEQSLEVFESKRFIVSLCEPINPKRIKVLCNNQVDEEVFFLHLVEPEYKNCLLFKKEDISVTYYNDNKKTSHILISIPNFYYKNGIVDELNYDIVLFEYDKHITKPTIMYNQATESSPYDKIKLILPENYKTTTEMSNYSLTSLDLKIGIATIQRLILFLSLFYVYFSFHLDTKLTETWEYPIQGVLMLHFWVSVSIFAIGLVGSTSFLVNSLIQFLIILIGVTRHRYLVGKFKRDLPLWLNLVVLPEAYVSMAENFSKYSIFMIYFFSFFFLLIVLGTITMCFVRVSKHKICHFDELVFSVLTSIRLTVYIFNMHKPYRNLFKVGYILGIRSTKSMEEISSLYLSFFVFSCCFVTFRLIAMASLRKTEKKILFEEYYNNLDDYMGSSHLIEDSKKGV